MSQAINAVYSKLSGTTAVTNLVGTNIEPQIAQQSDSYPCVLLEEESINFGGKHSGSDGTASANLNISCEGTDYDSASAVATAVRNALNFQKGTWGSTVVQGAFVEDESEEYEYISNDTPFYGVTIKVSVFYQL